MAYRLHTVQHMTIAKILAAVDFSEESDIAVKQALALARQQGAQLTLLHAGLVPEQPPGLPESMRAVADDYLRVLDEHLSADRRRLQDLRERLSGQGAEISHMVRDGPPAQAIVAAAAELGTDVIVTGSHGRTGLRRFLLGSVAERVVREARCHVLVARARADNPPQLRRILVPTDFSTHANRALDIAIALAGPDTRIDVLHCWYLAPFSYPHFAPPIATASQTLSVRETLVGASGAQGAQLMERHRDARCQLDFHLREAPAAAGIEEWLSAQPCDLVVMGSHGWRAPTRWLVGSVAEKTVRHANTSVLVVHDRPESESA